MLLSAFLSFFIRTTFPIVSKYFRDISLIIYVDKTVLIIVMTSLNMKPLYFVIGFYKNAQPTT